MLSIFIQLILLGICGYGMKKSNNPEECLCRQNTDTIRFFCCMGVLFSHIMMEGTRFYLGYPHFVYVTIFFFFSGYGLLDSYQRNPSLFLKNHPKRIIRMCIIPMAVLGIEFFLHLQLGAGGLSWFFVLALFYIAFGVTSLVFKDNYFKLLLVMLLLEVIYIVFFRLVGTFGAYPSNNLFIRNLGWEQQSIGFVLGMVFCKWKSKLIPFLTDNCVKLSCVSVFLLLPMGLLYIRPHDITKITNEQFALRVGISFLSIFLMLIFLSKFTVGNNLSVWGGQKMSIFIFAIHGMFIGLYEDIAKVNIDLYVLLVIVSSIFISFIISILSNEITKLGEKYSVMKKVFLMKQ